MARIIEYSSPFLTPEDDVFDLEAVTSMVEVASSARCGLSKQWLDAYPGEKVMLAPPQTSVRLDHTPSLWYESMQDMSGFVQSDTILPPLDEQLEFSISTAQTENDFYVQNPGLPSPAEFVLGDTSEDVISEDSDMFDNFNCDIINSKINECLPESPIKRNLYDNMYSDKTRTNTNMGDEERNFSPHKISFCFHKAKLAEEKPRYLAIIDSEEPLIKEDPDVLYCTQNKINFGIKADTNVSDTLTYKEPKVEDMDKVYCASDFKDMGVAEEVIVMTEEEDKYKANLSLPLLDSVSSDSEENLSILEEKPKKESDFTFKLDPFLGLETFMDNLFNDLDQIGDDLYSQIEADYNVSQIITPNEIAEDYNVRQSTVANDQLSNSTSIKLSPTSHLQNKNNHIMIPNNLLSRSTNSQMPPKLAPKHVSLTLDIDAARSALLVDKGISDTPELLEALKPEVGKFDLIKFITTNGDPNNNTPSPTVESHPKKLEAPRKGKSHLSLLDLKQAQNLQRGEALSRIEDERVEDEALPSTSGTSPSGRPARQSATRFKKMIEEGLLDSVVDSQSVSSDDEDSAPKAKRRRTTSTTSSRRRLNSDSDQSSVNEDAMKYRERRDRNNLSSKRSRQKRKMQHQLKAKELSELEEENARLTQKAEELESVLTRVKAAWADYLAQMKDSDKDRR